MQETRNSEIQEEETSNVSQDTQNENENSNNYAPEFDDWVKESPRHRYIRLTANEPKVLRFKSGRPDQMLMSDFGGKSPRRCR
jgi:hypothetical protein